MSSSAATSTGLRDPRWLLFTHLLPAGAVITIFLSAFRVIRTELAADVLGRWYTLGGALVGLEVLMVVVLLLSWASRKPVPWPVALISLFGHAVLCAICMLGMDQLIPFSVPRWMLPREIVSTSMGLLLIPTLHALLMLVDRTVRPGDRSWKSLLVSFGVIAFWFMLFFVLSGTGRFGRSIDALWIPLNVLMVLVFFFFLLRGLVIVVNARRGTWNASQLWWRILVGLGLPLTGLLVHNFVFGHQGTGPIGDFSSPWFYVAAVLNGVLCCVRPPADPRLRLLFFALRAIGFSYVLYFTLVFLPYLPFSLAFVLFFGVGLLMMAPLVLFVVQLGDLMRDVRALSGHRPRWILLVMALAGMAVLPGILYLSFDRDRRLLESALGYVYAPDLQAEAPEHITDEVIERLIERTDDHLIRRTFDFGSEGVPLLSAWYEQQVFDGLRLSEEKRARITRVFADHPPPETPMGWLGNPRRVGPQNGSVHLQELLAMPTYEEATRTWRTEVRLVMQNDPNAGWRSEYGTTFHLPEGAFVTNDWLMIGDRKAEGILADRKAATWIYEQITTVTYQDPSLLRYVGPNEVELRVFPFVAGETRVAGFEVVTKEPMPLTIDGMRVLLGDTSSVPVTPFTHTGPGFTYLSAKAKQLQPLVPLKPAYWIVVDRSADDPGEQHTYEKRITDLIGRPPLAGAEVHFMLCGRSAREVDALSWREQLGAGLGKGGYFLGRAMEHIALNALKTADGTTPIIISVTDHANEVIPSANAADLMAMAHAPLIYFHLDQDGELSARDMLGDPTTRLDATLDDVLAAPLRRFQTPKGGQYALPDDGEPSIIVGPREGGPVSDPPRSWAAAMHVRTLEHDLSQHPDLALREPHLLTKASFASHVLARSTAFICLETEAQEAALLKKQEEVLKASTLFDAGDELKPMSEPAEWIAIALFVFTLGLWRWRTRARAQHPA